MPMPMPNGSEDQETFMDRCMGDAMMNGDFPEEKQRLAVCERQWKGDGEGMMKANVECLLNSANDGAEGLVQIKLAPWGKVESTSGDFLVDEESVKLIEEAFAKHGNSLPIDYEHHTLGGAYASPTGRAIAAGWIEKINGRAGEGLFAMVKWTEPARTEIRQDQYRYLSPVAIVRKSDHKMIGLHSAALTNKPAIERMERLVAKQTDELPAGQRTLTKETETMELLEQLREKLGAPTDTAEMLVNKVGELKKRAETADAPGATVKAVCKELGLPEGAGGEAISVKIKLMQEAMANSDKSLLRLAEVEKQLTEIRVNKLHAMLEEKVKINAINPNEPSYAELKKLALTQPESFVVIVNGLTPQIPPGRTMPPEGGAKTGTAANRETIIVNAARKFDEGGKEGRLTSKEAFVNMALYDAAKTPLSKDEIQKLVA